MRPYLFMIERGATGIAHMTGQLTDALASYCDPTLICATSLGKYVHSNARVIEVDFPSHKYYPSFFTKMAKIVSQVRREKPDIVHFIDVAPAVTPFQIMLRSFPIIQVWHNVTDHPGDKNRFSGIYRNICPRIVDAIILHGEKLKSDFIAIKPEAAPKLRVLPHGTTKLFSGVEDTDYEQFEEDIVLLFGRINKYKGVDIFLKAAQAIHEQMPHVKFILAGKGDLTAYSDLIAVTKDYVEIHNYMIPDETIPELFKRTKVISMPYIEGSASGVLAMSHGFGKPAVITNVGSFEEYVEDGKTGLIVPAGNHIALAEATMKLLKDDDLRNKIKHNIRIKVDQELSYDCVARKLLGIYEEVIQNKRRSA